MTDTTNLEIENTIPVDLEVLVNEEDNAVYVKFTGFNDINEADMYAEFLSTYLPLMLFDSEVIH